MKPRTLLIAAVLFCLPAHSRAESPRAPESVNAFLSNQCLDCHDSATKKGGLDLETLSRDLSAKGAIDKWILIHDRVESGEMPPVKRERPAKKEVDAFLTALRPPLIAADRASKEAQGRTAWRRLNRFEYENALRDLLHAPWLQVSPMLPEDGEAHRFNKVSEALDVSHVQMARYLAAAEYAMEQILEAHDAGPKKSIVRYYAWEQSAFYRRVNFNEFNRSAERATFPMRGYEAAADVLTGKTKLTDAPAEAKLRQEQAMGVVASTYEPLEIKFNGFEAPSPGRYKLRISAYSFWSHPVNEKQYWKPDRGNLSKGRRDEPVVLYAETPPRLLRRLGDFDVTPEPETREIETYLLTGETIRPDPQRLFRSRPPNWHNPLAEKDGMPGVAFRWLEVEGPLHDAWPTKGYTLLFGDLPRRPVEGKAGRMEVVSAEPKKDAKRLLEAFMAAAYRRPMAPEESQRIVKLINALLDDGSPFEEAMLCGYAAVLCSPGFVYLQEKPGELDDHALASRLSFLLWNSAPDDELRKLATKGELHAPLALREQTQRLLNDERSSRFTNAFLDYWLDLRHINATSPDATLYPDYYLDDLLVESSVEETRAFFNELLRKDLPVRHLVSSDFAFVNERLAQHYELPAVKGVALQRVMLPKESPRGGLLTQASVLKVTANGTTTSPVVRGAWVMERILGKKPPPPPASVPAVEPDTRGATTIREQLDKHRELESCNACHAKIDPAGFALESFDVVGGWREQYRATAGGKRATGFGKNGQPFEFHTAQPIDASGILPGTGGTGGGGAFKDIRELKALLLADERQLARNLVRQFTVYATGSAVTFADRAEVERILDRAADKEYGVRSLLHELIQSELFRKK
ncbi:MAG: DUF1592 domain-containing protein [Phycisphaeraceae bacterium]